MNKYLILIALLLGVVSFLGFKSIQEPEVSATAAPDEVTAVETEEVGSDIDRGGDVIDMSNQGLAVVPEYIFKKTGTRVLILADNKLSGSLPAEVRHLQSLQVLDLSGNNFTGIPAEIGQLKYLEILDLSGNPITGLPLELGNLESLKLLDLRDTDYSEYDLDIIKKSLPEGVEVKVK